MRPDPSGLSAVRKAMDMAGVRWMYLDESGEAVLPEGAREKIDLPPSLRGKAGVPVRCGGRTLISPDARGGGYLCLCAEGDEIDVYAALACELLRAPGAGCGEGGGRSALVRLLLSQGTSATDAEAAWDELALSDGRRRCAMCVWVPSAQAREGALGVVTSLAEDGGDLCASMGHGCIALLHAVADEESAADAEQFALALAQSIGIEAGSRALVGISRDFSGPGEAPGAYAEAREAVELGRTYRRTGSVFRYAGMLPERLLRRIPRSDADAFRSQFFTGPQARLFTEESLREIEALFENGLNISETARKLYIHRNTLVYRLDKIAKSTGLDLRRFDDAMTFRLLMLLHSGGDGAGNT